MARRQEVEAGANGSLPEKGELAFEGLQARGTGLCHRHCQRERGRTLLERRLFPCLLVALHLLADGVEDFLYREILELATQPQQLLFDSLPAVSRILFVSALLLHVRMRPGQARERDSHHSLFARDDFPSSVFGDLSQLGPDVGVITPFERTAKRGSGSGRIAGTVEK